MSETFLSKCAIDNDLWTMRRKQTCFIDFSFETIYNQEFSSNIDFFKSKINFNVKSDNRMS